MLPLRGPLRTLTPPCTFRRRRFLPGAATTVVGHLAAVGEPRVALPVATLLWRRLVAVAAAAAAGVVVRAPQMVLRPAAAASAAAAVVVAVGDEVTGWNRRRNAILARNHGCGRGDEAALRAAV